MTSVLGSLRQIFGEILLCSADSLPLDRPYSDLGIDSILAIQLTKAIQSVLGHALTTADIYNAVTIKQLAALIDRRPKIARSASDSPVRGHQSPIAVTGIAGQFPGASTVEALWRLLSRGSCSITTSSRWSARFKGGFLPHIDRFDGEFFHLSPKAVTLMDPQQRLLLENAYLAFQDSGLSPERLEGRRVGVFITSLPGDYRQLIQHTADAYHPLSFTGNAVSLYAAQISYYFNLKGPSIYLDTACSSSLVCLDQAIRHLRDRTCEVALVGASSLFATTELFQLAQSTRLLSPLGSCWPFDASADGFVPSEMVICAVLQRPEETTAAPYGLIKAIGVNHDGLTNGIMSPNSDAQAELIQNLYADHAIDPCEIGYLEAHGTGTPIGDPIELQALQRAFSGYVGEPIAIGSMKANIGHGLVASGLASLCKVLKIFEHQFIPPQIHYAIHNPNAPLGNFWIPTQAAVWPKQRSLAAISAFGFGGTNAHMVLERALQVRQTAAREGVAFQKKAYWIAARSPKDPGVEQAEFVQEQVASLLGYQNSRELPLNRTLADLGMDSLLLLRLLESLPAAYQKKRGQALLSKTVEDLIVQELPAATVLSRGPTLEWCSYGPENGQPLILLPPLNTLAGVWIQQKSYWSQRGWRLLIPHYPGHGNSPYEASSLAMIADTIQHDLSADFNLQGAVPMVGWSLGGCIALLLATQIPEMISSLTLVATAANFGDDLFTQSAELKRALLSHQAYLRRLYQVTDPLAGISAGCSMEILAHYYRELVNFSHLRDLPTLTKRCLILHGGKDTVINREQLQILQTIPNQKTLLLEEEGHFIPLTAPWIFNQALMKFLDNGPGGVNAAD